MKNIYLINQFDKIKIPFWVYWMPILGPKLYWDFFRSLFREFDERNFIWRFKRKYMFLSFGIFIINAFLVLFINIILFVILLSLDVSLIYCLYFFIASFGLTFIFEFIYQPLITMKSKSIIKKSYNHYYWSKYDREVDYLFKVSDFTGWDFTDYALIGIVSVDYNGNPGLVCSQFKPYIRADQYTSEDYMMIGTVNNTGADVTTFMQIGCLFTLKQYRYVGYAYCVNSELNS